MLKRLHLSDSLEIHETGRGLGRASVAGVQMQLRKGSLKKNLQLRKQSGARAASSAPSQVFGRAATQTHLPQIHPAGDASVRGREAAAGAGAGAGAGGMKIDDPLDFEGEDDPLLTVRRPAKRYSRGAAIFLPLESNPVSFFDFGR